MLACLALEERGIHSRQYRSGRGRIVRLPSANRKPWVAKILGTCEVYGYEREFVKSYNDYRNASRSGRSGIWHWYFLPPGCYEAHKVLNSQKTRRFFFMSEKGSIREIEKDEVDAWLSVRS